MCRPLWRQGKGRILTVSRTGRRMEKSVLCLRIVSASWDSLHTIESCGSTQSSREEYYILELSQSLHPIDERATVDAPSIPFSINSRDLEFSTSHQALRSTHSSCALVLVTTISHSHRAAQDTPGTKNLYCQDSSTSSTSHLSSTTAATCPLLNAVARGNRLDAPCLNSSSLGNEWT